MNKKKHSYKFTIIFSISILVHLLIILIFSLQYSSAPVSRFQIELSKQRNNTKASQAKNKISKHHKLENKKNSKISSATNNTESNNENKSITELDSSMLTTLNSKIQNSMPYPEIAQRMNWQGKARIKLNINNFGQVKVKLIKSSGYQVLDQQVLKTVNHWQFGLDYYNTSFELNFKFLLR